jgi:small subunit ribosomal protein S18
VAAFLLKHRECVNELPGSVYGVRGEGLPRYVCRAITAVIHLHESEPMPPAKSKSKSAAKKERRPKRKVCTFCADRLEPIDYKDQTRLRKYISERGKILPRRISGNCASHQRALTVAVKRARVIALLPFVVQ